MPSLFVSQNHALDAWFGKNYIVEEDIKTPLFQDCFAGVLGLSLTSGGRSRRVFGFPNAMLAETTPQENVEFLEKFKISYCNLKPDMVYL